MADDDYNDIMWGPTGIPTLIPKGRQLHRISLLPTASRQSLPILENCVMSTMLCISNHVRNNCTCQLSQANSLFSISVDRGLYTVHQLPRDHLLQIVQMI